MYSRVKFKLFIILEKNKISRTFRLKLTKLVTYPAYKCWHFKIYENDKF